MQNLKEWTPSSDSDFSNRKILAFDLDDTLTEDLHLNLEAVDLLQKARLAGLKTVLVTGRPFGWADALVRLLPFDAAVAENGAIVFHQTDGGPTKSKARLDCWYWCADSKYSKEELPQERIEELHSLRSEVLKIFPGVKIAADQASRLYDVAFDFAEGVEPPLSLSEAQDIADYCEKRGFTAKVSSIHVNVWRGIFSKREALDFLVSELWDGDLRKDVIYVGDSPNDAPLFAAVDVSVGVANIQSFIDAKIEFPLPQYRTDASYGAGAAEVIQHRLEFL